MSVRNVGGTVLAPNGAPLSSVPIVIELVLAEAFVVIGSYSLAGKLTVQTDPAGRWSTPLQCNDELTPVGTLYQVTEKVPNGTKVYLIQVLAGLPTPPAINEVLNLIVPELTPVGGSYAPVGSGPQGLPGVPGYVTVADNTALNAQPKVVGQATFVTGTGCLWLWNGTFYELINIPRFPSQAAADLAFSVSQHKGQPFYLQTGTATEGPLWRNNNNVYSRPWNQSWGEIIYVEHLANTPTGIGAADTDIPALTTGVLTAPANRIWWVHGFCWFLGVGGATRPILKITDEANVILGQAIAHLAAAGQYCSLDAWDRFSTGAGGPITRKLRAITNSSTIDVVGTTGQPAFIRVWDMGPAGVPA